MNILTVIRQMAILFLMIATGYAANKLGYMDSEAETKGSRLVINVTNPCLIITSVVTSSRMENSSMLAVVFLSAIVYYLLMTFVSRGLVKLMRVTPDRQAEYECMLIYSNIGFIGLPVAGAVLGREAILYIAICCTIFNIHFFGYGILVLREGGKFRLSQLKSCINPGSIASVLAVIFYLWNVTLPDIVLSAMNSVAGITTPFAMIIIGSSLAGYNLKAMLKNKALYGYSFLRLIALPAATIFCVKYLISDPLLQGTLVLISAMPAASSVVMGRKDIGKDATFSSMGIAFSTFFCVITIPISIAIMNFIIG